MVVITNSENIGYTTPTSTVLIITTDNQLPTKEITNLIKIYSDEEGKYRGEMYDILDAKL
jgi:hypothetical protein